jgi:signal transduction histidine kinase
MARLPLARQHVQSDAQLAQGIWSLSTIRLAAETSRAISEVKQISYDLRPFHLDRIGLTRSIESLIDNVAKACDIKFSVDLD